MGDPPDPVPPDKNLPSSEVRKRPHEDELDTIPKKSVISPGASSQLVYVCPQFANNKELRYEETDLGPFVVQVSKVVPDPASGTSMRILKLAQMLYNNKVCGISTDGVKSIGRNKASIEFKTSKDANTFLNSAFVTKNDFEAIIPVFQLTRMGIVKDIPLEWSMEEFVESLECPSGIGQIMKARRLSRKTFVDGSPVWIPTRTVTLTFKGKIRPKRVFCFNAAIPVETYQLPVIQCLACCRFGHTHNICRSKPRCFKCAQPHTGNTCDVPEEESKCMFCPGHHFSTNKKCPEHGRQKLIKNLVSDENITYNEAAERVPKVNRLLYTDVTKTPHTSPTTPSSSPVIPSKEKSGNTSHRKTIIINRRPSSSLNKTYNIQEHNNIVSTPSSSMGNGCALVAARPQPNDNLLELMLYTLLNMISKFEDALPHNVINLLEQITQSVKNNNGPDPSMEYEECPIQKE